jgi:hypothetical protein
MDTKATEYKFAVGDRVITASGRKGTIVNVCSCKYCQERGFLEPEVKYDDSDYRDYIMLCDLENHFKSFYSIGDYIFGNLIPYEELEMQAQRKKQELEYLNQQINTIKQLTKDRKTANEVK